MINTGLLLLREQRWEFFVSLCQRPFASAFCHRLLSPGRDGSVCGCKDRAILHNLQIFPCRLPPFMPADFVRFWQTPLQVPGARVELSEKTRFSILTRWTLGWKVYLEEVGGYVATLLVFLETQLDFFETQLGCIFGLIGARVAPSFSRSGLRVSPSASFPIVESRRKDREGFRTLQIFCCDKGQKRM